MQDYQLHTQTPFETALSLSLSGSIENFAEI